MATRSDLWWPDRMHVDPKSTLIDHLQECRDALVGKVEGLSERDARLPRTPTGTNLLGIVKHALNVEAVYFGPTFEREFPGQGLVTPAEYDADPQSDWFATESESLDGVLALYREVQTFADETISGLDLDAVGRVAHWRGQEVTLHQILVHTLGDLQRHAGHADILREMVDGSVGMREAGDNVPQDVDWPSYVTKLVALADRFVP